MISKVHVATLARVLFEKYICRHCFLYSTS